MEWRRTRSREGLRWLHSSLTATSALELSPLWRQFRSTRLLLLGGLLLISQTPASEFSLFFTRGCFPFFSPPLRPGRLEQGGSFKAASRPIEGSADRGDKGTRRGSSSRRLNLLFARRSPPSSIRSSRSPSSTCPIHRIYPERRSLNQQVLSAPATSYVLAITVAFPSHSLISLLHRFSRQQ